MDKLKKMSLVQKILFIILMLFFIITDVVMLLDSVNYFIICLVITAVLGGSFYIFCEKN